MIKIINKSNAPIYYNINGVEFDLKVNIPSVFTEEEYKLLLSKFGCFINEIKGKYLIIEKSKNKEEKQEEPKEEERPVIVENTNKKPRRK